MKCLIMAGGFGTRLYPLTINRPKAFLEFKGKAVIDHIISRIPEGIDILVSTNKKFEETFVEWEKRLDTPVQLLVEEIDTDRDKKGAVGALHHWIGAAGISEDLMVIAADNYFEFDLADMMCTYNGRNAILAVHDVGDKAKACEIGQACQTGLVIVRDDKIVRFELAPEEPISSLVGAGISILPQRTFGTISRYLESHEPDNLGGFIAYLCQLEDVYAYVFDSMWMDIGDEILRGKIKA